MAYLDVQVSESGRILSAIEPGNIAIVEDATKKQSESRIKQMKRIAQIVNPCHLLIRGNPRFKHYQKSKPPGTRRI